MPRRRHLHRCSRGKARGRAGRFSVRHLCVYVNIMYSFQYIDMHALLWLVDWLVDCERTRRHVARVLGMWGGELVAISGPGHSQQHGHPHLPQRPRAFRRRALRDRRRGLHTHQHLPQPPAHLGAFRPSLVRCQHQAVSLGVGALRAGKSSCRPSQPCRGIAPPPVGPCEKPRRNLCLGEKSWASSHDHRQSGRFRRSPRHHLSGPVPSNDLRRRREGHTRLLERRGPTFPPRRARATPVHRNVNHRSRRIETNAGRCSSPRVRRQLGGVLRRHQRRGFTGLRASQATTDGGGFARPGFCAHRGPHPGGGEARAPDRHENDG